jgi:hypothetical protein
MFSSIKYCPITTSRLAIGETSDSPAVPPSRGASSIVRGLRKAGLVIESMEPMLSEITLPDPISLADKVMGWAAPKRKRQISMSVL